MDILYLRRKNDCDIWSFDKYDDCRWKDLSLLKKAAFDDAYKHRVVPFLISSKRNDLSFINKHLIDIKYVEFSGYYELFHLTDSLFVSLTLELVNTKVFQLHGLVLDGLVDSFGSLKNQKGIILPHIAKLMCCLLDINIEDKIFVPNCGAGELLIYSDYQALISRIPPSRRGQDSDGLDDLVNIDDSFLKTNHHLVQQYATENDEVLSYICAMNIFLHGIEMKHQIDELNFWDERFLNKFSNKFSKILVQIIEKESKLRQLKLMQL